MALFTNTQWVWGCIECLILGIQVWVGFYFYVPHLGLVPLLKIKMKVDITVEDYTIILNALHYYKKVEKIGNFDQYTDVKVNALRDKLAQQMVWEQGFIE